MGLMQWAAEAAMRRNFIIGLEEEILTLEDAKLPKLLNPNYKQNGELPKCLELKLSVGELTLKTFYNGLGDDPWGKDVSLAYIEFPGSGQADLTKRESTILRSALKERIERK